MKRDYFFSGIQQVGIGTMDFARSWQWYIDHFQMDIKILEDDTVAERMLPYTGGEPRKRRACIAINLQGGGGFEVWHYSEREPKPASFEIRIGDLGIFAAKIKSRDVAALHREMAAKYPATGPLTTSPDGKPTFYLADPFGNHFQVVDDPAVFIEEHRLSGGAAGALIGVSDINRSLPVYQDILGYDRVLYDETGLFADWSTLPGGEQPYRRMLLGRSTPFQGAFSPLLGSSVIELVEALDRKPEKIYEGRYWGDPGFIQICFDVVHMEGLERYCRSKGFPFTVDSCPGGEVFDMGEASGHFTYIEDPDGTLIEFVETYKIPVLKKLGWYINLLGRNREKPLPKFLFRLMRAARVKSVS